MHMIISTNHLTVHSVVYEYNGPLVEYLTDYSLRYQSMNHQ